jgi:transposase-like protein
MPTNLTDPIFHDEEKARAHFEAIRWPDGKPVCPHCGVIGQTTLVNGKSHRPGMYQCNACREPFTAMIGTVMESSHVPMTKWALAFHLMASSKKGVSAHQLMRTLGLGSYRTAWFMAHRVREAMDIRDPEPLGGKDKTVEADETFIGRLEGVPKQKSGSAPKNVVLTLVERGGSARSFHVESTRRADVEGVIRANIRKESRLMTDEGRHYKAIGREFASHEAVNHGEGEYGRGEVHTNTVEGFYSVFKRGMKGVYQHCGENHLQAYVNEFDFRYSNRIALGVDDTERTRRAIKGAHGKRLTYRQPRRAQPGRAC